VDDDAEVTHLLERYLALEGFDVATAVDWHTTSYQFKKMQPDLVILDLGLPGIGGLDIASRLRECSDAGIIMLTGSQDKLDRIVGLESGADDYIQKPFDNRELLARIRSLLRRLEGLKTNGNSAGNSSRLIGFSGWNLDKVAGELCDANGELVDLTQGEFQLLVLFVDNVNGILSRDLISETLSSRDWMPTSRSIDVMVGKLRQKLNDSKRQKLIKTIRGKGYIFTSDVSYDETQS
jgi:DNA-binding response OmpR family regulator